MKQKVLIAVFYLLLVIAGTAATWLSSFWAIIPRTDPMREVSGHENIQLSMSWIRQLTLEDRKALVNYITRDSRWTVGAPRITPGSSNNPEYQYVASIREPYENFFIEPQPEVRASGPNFASRKVTITISLDSNPFSCSSERIEVPADQTQLDLPIVENIMHGSGLRDSQFEIVGDHLCIRISETSPEFDRKLTRKTLADLNLIGASFRSPQSYPALLDEKCKIIEINNPIGSDTNCYAIGSLNPGKPGSLQVDYKTFFPQMIHFIEAKKFIGYSNSSADSFFFSMKLPIQVCERPSGYGTPLVVTPRFPLIFTDTEGNASEIADCKLPYGVDEGAVVAENVRSLRQSGELAPDVIMKTLLSFPPSKGDSYQSGDVTRVELLLELEKQNSMESINTLLGALRANDDFDTRIAGSLVRMPGGLEQALKTKDAEKRTLLAKSLYPYTARINSVYELVSDPEITVRCAAISSLGTMLGTMKAQSFGTLPLGSAGMIEVLKSKASNGADCELAAAKRALDSL